jgi:gas vesicle protein
MAPQSGEATREVMRKKLRETDIAARALKDRIVRGAKSGTRSRRVGGGYGLAGNGADSV